MPRHRMTLSRHQDKLLQTPATLETLGSTSQFRCIALKPGRQHVSTHGYTVVEQPVARDLLQSLAAGIMLVEPQQSSDNSPCSHPAASNTSQAGIICHKLQHCRLMGFQFQFAWRLVLGPGASEMRRNQCCTQIPRVYVLHALRTKREQVARTGVKGCGQRRTIYC